MEQGSVVASLLKQQQDILKELRDRKKEISLSQSNKEEIARLVLSSIEKRHLQDPRLVATQKPYHIEALRAYTGRSKRVKPVRHLQRPFRSSDTIRTIRGGPIEQPTDEHKLLSPEHELDNKPSEFSFPLCKTSYYEEDQSTSTTIIRQSTERRPETVQVSLDGSWLLPSTPLPENQNKQDELQSPEIDCCWAEQSRITMSSSPRKSATRTRRWLDSEEKTKPRPSTMASNVYQARGPAWRRRRVGCPSNRSPSCEFLVDPSTSGVEQREPGSETDYSRSVNSDGENEGEGAGEVKMNRDTAVMLERSRELVARAKAFYINPGRSPPPRLLGERERDKTCKAEGSVLAGYDMVSMKKSDPGENHGELDQLMGEASPIVLPSFSPRVAPLEVGVARKEDIDRRLAPISEAKRDGTAIVDPAPERSDVDRSYGIGGWRVRQEDSTIMDRLGDDLESVPAGAVDDRALATPSLPSYEGDETVRKPERSGREEECLSKSDCSQCGVKAEGNTTVATRGMAISGGHPSAPFEAGASPVRFVPNGATTLSPHEHRSLDVRGGASWEHGALSKSSLSARSGAPGQCHEGTNTVRLKGRRDRSRDGGGCVRRCEGKGMVEGGDGEDGADSPVKVGSEWENTLARNILSLYQTKLKAEFDVKKSGRDEGSMRNEPPGYLRVEQERLNNGDTCDGTTQSMNRSFSLRRRETNPCKYRDASPHDRTLPTGSSCSRRRPMTVGAAMTVPITGSRSCSCTGIRNKGDVTPGVPEASGESKEKTSSRTRIRREMEGGLGTLPSNRTSFNTGTAAMAMVRGRFRGSRTISVPTRGGREVVVMVPERPAPIWFAGSGAIQAEWSALPGGARVARDLESLEEYGSYRKYVAVVEGLLAAHLRADDQRGPTILVKRLWRQLVVTCTAFGVRSTENRRFERALELLKRAEILLSRQVLDKRETMELRAFIWDAYGLYYLRRSKPTAALDYIQKAMRTHVCMEAWGHVAKCHLHSAVVLSKLKRHDEALRCLGQVLSMVQDGKLDIGGNSPQKLCLIAICYHNMAVEQLILRHAGQACMSSQNARRLARLCLSYSNRWLHSFEGTHKLALAELAKALPPPGENKTKGQGRRNGSGSRSTGEVVHRGMLDRLVEELFS